MCFTQKLRRAEDAAARSLQSGLPHLLRAGTGPVLFSAPHSVEQTRQGRRKPAEPQTAVLAELLHAETGCPILYKTAHCGDDANFDAVCPYKDALADYISGGGVRFVIDLHQLAPARDVMVDIGTGGGKNGCTPAALNVFLRAFSARPLGVVQVDEPFGACFAHTVSAATARRCGVACVQLELNTRLLRPDFEEYDMAGVLDALCDCRRLLCRLLEEG